MKQARILVFGGTGMLGRDLVQTLSGRGHSVTSPDEKDFDILLTSSLARMASRGSFDWVVNCAAYTAVDKAEDDIAAATSLNGKAAGSVAAMCCQAGWRLLHLSTDYVFDGESDRPYQEDDRPSPASVYGRTKLLGEQLAVSQLPDAVICRTAWLYGVHGKSFPRTMIEAWKAGKELKVVNDQTGCPTSTTDLSAVLAQMIESEIPGGIYHAVGPEAMTWHELATRAVALYRDLVVQSAQPVEILPVPTSAFPTRARRPRMSVLSTAKLAAAGIPAMRPVDQSLAEFVQRLG